MIPLKGLDKAKVLAALYNASTPQGMGFLQYDPGPMTVSEARELLEKHRYFDYLKGRVMKIDLSGDLLDPYLYDRDNGEGAAQRAIDADCDEIEKIHSEGKKKSAEIVREHLHEDSKVEERGDWTHVTLGLSGIADKLGPAIDRAVDSCDKV